MNTLTLAELKKAVSLREKIDLLQNELNKLLGSAGAAAPAGKKAKGKRKMSAAGRAAISKAAKARWAKAKASGKKRL